MPSSVGNQQFGSMSFALSTFAPVAGEFLTNEVVVGSPTDDKLIERPLGSTELGEKGLDAIRRGPRTQHEKYFNLVERC